MIGPDQSRIMIRLAEAIDPFGLDDRLGQTYKAGPFPYYFGENRNGSQLLKKQFFLMEP
jgi:hypothetical protein